MNNSGEQKQPAEQDSSALMNLIWDLSEGTISDADMMRLNELLLAEPANRMIYARFMKVITLLEHELTLPEAEDVNRAFVNRQLRDRLLSERDSTSLEARGESEVASRPPTRLVSLGNWSASIYSFAPRVAVLLLGAIVGSLVTWQVAVRWMTADRPITSAIQPGAPDRHGAISQVATLANVTNCRWDQALSTADLKQGSVVRSGESLHLLEGVAEVNSTLQNGGLARLQLEGPLVMTLNSQGMPSLMYGHLTGKFSCDYDQFTLDTPLGRMNLSGEASIGVIAAANKVELHVFAGTATLKLWAMGISGTSSQLTASAGTALSARVEADGNVEVERGEAKESGFVTPAALAASHLRITREYVDTIRAGKPFAYWRFEGDADGVMRNEMSDRFHCRMVGNAVRWHTGEGNSTAEFGMTAGPGYLLSDDNLDGMIKNDYSLEAWVKPTYFHHGALISLIQWTPEESPLDRHRLHLELVGPCPGVPSSILRAAEVHPGRIRFIHQSMAIYSESPYRARAWQHVAAVRNGSLLQLYADGKVVAKAEDSSDLGSGLRVLMGQLFPRNSYVKDEVSARLFVGELDEVALYNRPLSDAEIEKHVQLARPVSDASSPKANGNL